MFEYLFSKEHYPSHYEEEAEGPIITVVKKSLLLPKKLAEACKHLEDYPREYIPAPKLTAEQKKAIELAKEQRKHDNEMFDSGFWKPIGISNQYRIKYGEEKI